MVRLNLGETYGFPELQEMGFESSDFPVGRNVMLRSYGNTGVRLDRGNTIYLGVKTNELVRIIEHIDLETGTNKTFVGDT
ncbi:MAG: hypothetical protein ACE5ES_00930 [Candidatus Nanoarchaeia archaeon]